MPQYLQRGSIPPKRHIAHRTSPGYQGEGIFYEEVISTEGFHRAYSIAYHLRPPTRVLAINAMPPKPVAMAEPDALRHIHLKTSKIMRVQDAIHGRLPLFQNADVRITRSRPALEQELFYRNTAQDELWFVRSGTGRLLSMFGSVPFRDLDYLVIPRCTTFKIEFDAIDQADLLIVESRGTIGFPSRYMNPDGQFRLGAPFCERDLRGLNGSSRSIPKDPTSLNCAMEIGGPSTSSGIIRSMSSDGMVLSIHSPSTLWISSRLPGWSINPHPSIKRSKPTGSSCAPLHLGCSIPILRPSRFLMRTAMSNRTNCSTTWPVSSGVGVVSNSIRSPCTRTGSPMAPTQGRSPRVAMRSGPTNWR